MLHASHECLTSQTSDFDSLHLPLKFDAQTSKIYNQNKAICNSIIFSCQVSVHFRRSDFNVQRLIECTCTCVKIYEYGVYKSSLFIWFANTLDFFDGKTMVKHSFQLHLTFHGSDSHPYKRTQIINILSSVWMLQLASRGSPLILIETTFKFRPITLSTPTEIDLELISSLSF